MKHLIRSLEMALETDNHYAALSMAFTIPDICGWVLDPNSGSKARCVAWFEKYIQSIYTKYSKSGDPEHVFLNGSDFYALRCAYLHEGRDEIINQPARTILESFQFVVPPKGWVIHTNQKNKTLQLQVDLFCKDIAIGTNKFLNNISTNVDAMKRLNRFLFIRDVNGNPV